jgi:hypothetical protein
MLGKLVAAVLAGALFNASAGSPVEEYRVKGAFLLNFANFVEWPSDTFKGPHDAIVICVLGTSPFSPDLDAAARKVLAQNRPVAVQLIPDPQHVAGCHIVFVSVSDRRRVHALIGAVKGTGVLTVGESEGFIAGGGIIEFKVEENRVKMEISTAAAKSAGLTISSRLLNLVQSDK